MRGSISVAAFFYFVCVCFGIVYHILGNNTEGHSDDPKFGHGTGDDFEFIKSYFGNSTELLKSIIWAYRIAIGDLDFPNG